MQICRVGDIKKANLETGVVWHGDSINNKVKLKFSSSEQEDPRGVVPFFE